MTSNALQTYNPNDEYSIGDDIQSGDREFVSFNGKYGCFVSSQNKDDLTLRELEGVILRTDLPSRAYFTKGEKRELLCSSRDGIIPKDVKSAQAIGCGPTCATCAFHDWQEDGDRRVAPACKLSINLLIASPIEELDQEPVLISLRVGGSSTTVLRQFLALLNKQRQSVSPKRPPFAYLVRLSGEHKRIADAGIDYFVLKCQQAGDVPPLLWPAYAGLYNTQHARIEATKAQAKAAEAETLPAPPPPRTTFPDPVNGDDLPFSAPRSVR